MLKFSVKILLKLYQKLFNLILGTGHFPDQWCEGLKTDLRIILNERLNKFTMNRNTIHPSQIGFQSGHRTADHIFTLKTIIDQHKNQNKNGKSMHAS